MNDILVDLVTYFLLQLPTGTNLTLSNTMFALILPVSKHFLVLLYKYQFSQKLKFQLTTLVQESTHQFHASYFPVTLSSAISNKPFDPAHQNISNSKKKSENTAQSLADCLSAIISHVKWALWSATPKAPTEAVSLCSHTRSPPTLLATWRAYFLLDNLINSIHCSIIVKWWVSAMTPLLYHCMGWYKRYVPPVLKHPMTSFLYHCMSWCKKDVIPVLIHWISVSFTVPVVPRASTD